MWKEKDNQLIRELKFKDFVVAFEFMKRVAGLAEELDHHPWWSNVYNVVTIKLTTHSAGNLITEKDREMAKRIDGILTDF